MLQYYELALILSVLTNLEKKWAEAQNKLASKRQCLSAIMTIVMATVLAHSIVRSFYTVRESSAHAD